MTNMIEQARSNIQQLRPYQPGKPIDELAREMGLNAEDIVKLASNENPLGPSPKALEAIQAEFAELTRYPDGNGFELKKALCEKLGTVNYKIGPEQLTLGNGSSDILEFIVKVFVSAGDEVVFSQHAFAIYALVSKMQGAECIAVPAKDYGHDLDAMADAITDKTRIVFVTNPNNPTGTWLNKTELSDFLNKVPSNVIVLLDEAYFEYVDEAEYPNGIDYLAQYPNLVITRTFSKAYGLASLRVGYGISHPDVADLMNRVRPPFNVNSMALAAAVATLSDDEYVDASKKLNDDGLKYLIAEFDRLGLPYIPSVGNFISFEIPAEKNISAADVNQKLLQAGVIVRPVANYEMPNHLRVSVGTGAENKAFIEAMNKILG